MGKLKKNQFKNCGENKFFIKDDENFKQKLTRKI